MTELRRVVREFVALAVIGVGIGLVANAFNPNGLSLTRNYFAKPVIKPPHTQPGNGTRPHTTTQVGSGPSTQPPTTRPPTTQAAEMTEEEMVQRLKDRGFQAIYHTDVVEVFNSDYLGDGVYVIIDARSDGLYQAGHIPGAYQLDHYYLDRYIDKVLEACKFADKIVVYCNGGDCEDSEFAVGDLMEKEVPPDKLNIYAGGFTMWKANGMKYETGRRNSGQITQETPKTGGQANQGAAK